MNAPSELPAAAYEPSDARGSFVLVTAGAVALGIAFCLVTAAWVYRRSDLAARPTDPTMTFRHGVVDESAIVRDWSTQDAAVRDHLENYAWADRGAGLGRIPIGRAMDLMTREAAAQPEKSP